MGVEGDGADNEYRISWLASFPKSGNTWTRILLTNLMATEPLDEETFAALPGSISSNRPGFDALTGLPSSDLTDDEIDLARPGLYRQLAAEADRHLFVKVHDGYHDCGDGRPLFPAEVSKGAVYLVRHPYDVAVSYASHQGHGDFDRAVKQINNPDHIMAGGAKSQLRQRTLGWKGHYRSWTSQHAIPVLVVRYEDMLTDTRKALASIADFLDLEEKNDPQRIAAAVERSSFEILRTREDRVGFSERPEKARRFFRSGRAGDGLAMLSERQRNAIWDVNGDVMEELGYDR
ncbi:sulfotransferase domain-containing protein [Aurantiacibacter spongiae]|nr:sulfotransferase domain-containing protein [Aurantiacibacter spongiae]